MKNIINIQFILILPFLSFGQGNVDTFRIYDVSIEVYRKGNNEVFKIDDKEVTKEQFYFVKNINSKIKLCTPCYAIMLDADSFIKSEGLYYGTCPNKERIEKNNFKFSKKCIEIIKNPCKEGEWIYYNRKGRITKRKFYILDN